MFGLVLFIIITALLWVLALHLDKKKKDIGVGVVAGIATIASLVLIVTIFVICDRQNDDRNFHEKREFYAYVVKNFEDATTLDAYAHTRVVSIEAVSRMVSNAEDINKRIELNKKYCENPLIGFFFSKSVANEELIEIPTLYITNFTITHE